MSEDVGEKEEEEKKTSGFSLTVQSRSDDIRSLLI